MRRLMKCEAKRQRQAAEVPLAAHRGERRLSRRFGL